MTSDCAKTQHQWSFKSAIIIGVEDALVSINGYSWAARVEVKSQNVATARSPAPAMDPAQQELYVLRAPSGDASE